MTVPPIISGLGKATNIKFGRYIQRVHTNKSPLKIWENRERWRIQGLPKFLEYPVLSQERILPFVVNKDFHKATNFKYGRYIHRVHPNKSPLKFERKWSVGVLRDCPNFLSTPIISGTDKATNFKFCMHILSIDRTKALYKFREK